MNKRRRCRTRAPAATLAAGRTHRHKYARFVSHLTLFFPLSWPEIYGFVSSRAPVVPTRQQIYDRSDQLNMRMYSPTATIRRCSGQHS